MRVINADRLYDEIRNWQGDIHDNEDDAEKFDFVFERIYEMLNDMPTPSICEKCKWR